jgi:hypothetical protein
MGVLATAAFCTLRVLIALRTGWRFGFRGAEEAS